MLSGLATTLLTLSLRLPYFGAAWYYAQWFFLAACVVCAIAMGSRRQQSAAFTPMSGGDVDGIDEADPESLARPTERTPVLGGGGGGGLREPRSCRGGGKKPGKASRGERSSGGSSAGEQWWAQGGAGRSEGRSM